MASPFRTVDGGLTLDLGEEETLILQRIIGELRAGLQSPERPEHLRRLFPPAYEDDAEAQRDFAQFTTDDLVAQKAHALDAVERLLNEGSVIGAEDQQALLTVLNDARLALGTRLGVTEEDDRESEPETFERAVYHWLGWLQANLIDHLLIEPFDL